MIPLKDRNPSRSYPLVNYSIIALNVLVFLNQPRGSDPALEQFAQQWGVVPYWLIYGEHVGSWVTPFTSMFIHGGWFHLLTNMWFLHVFGDNVEDELGKIRYVMFYLLCGLGGVAGQVAISPASTTPMVGASGAIAGVLGGYVLLHPRAPILTLVPIFIFLQFIEIPAYFYIFIWFGLQVLNGVFTMDTLAQAKGGVAFFAHIGGFVVGLATVRMFRRKAYPTHGWSAPGR